MKLSKRLNKIVEFVPIDASFIADIGADHGYIPLKLLENRDNISIFASDNKIGPFSRLKTNLSSKNNVILSLSSGLDELPSNVDTVIISGMGGGLIKSILEKGSVHFSHVKYFLLSPHKEEDLVRSYLYENGYIIEKEDFIKDDNKFYSIILFKKGEGNLSYLDAKYGPFIRVNKNDDFKEYINNELTRLNALKTIKNIDSRRLNEIMDEIKELESL